MPLIVKVNLVAVVLIIEAESPYFQSIIEGMKPSLGNGQTLDVVASVKVSDADFRSIIPRVASKQYDAVGVFLVTGQIAAFYQQTLQLKFDAPFFGTDFFEILVNDNGLPFNQITVYLNAQTRNTGTAIVTDQNWHHIAFVQTNGVFVLYVDGIQDFYFSGSSFSFDSFDYFSIGCAYWAPSLSYINGRLSNIRIVNGTAIYTETFTPPTAPLTAISGTILLLNTPFNENYLVDSSPFQLVGSVNGNVASSSENPYN
jgi:hypothetical protein